jgi:hypothetical protein
MRLLRFLFMMLVFVISACASVSAGPHLSSAEVLRLADTEARRHSDRYNPSHFNRAEPKYASRFHAWWVSYNPKPGTKGREAFTIEVDDNTRQAGLILP